MRSHNLRGNCGSSSEEKDYCKRLASTYSKELPPRDQAQPQFEGQLCLLIEGKHYRWRLVTTCSKELPPGCQPKPQIKDICVSG